MFCLNQQQTQQIWYIMTLRTGGSQAIASPNSDEKENTKISVNPMQLKRRQRWVSIFLMHQLIKVLSRERVYTLSRDKTLINWCIRKILTHLYLRFNCIGFTDIFVFSFSSLFGLAIAYDPPVLRVIIYQIYYVCCWLRQNIPFSLPQYIMEDELSPPRSNHKEELNLYKATML